MSVTAELQSARWMGAQKQYLYKRSYVQHTPTRVRVHTRYKRVNDQGGKCHGQGRILIGRLGRAAMRPYPTAGQQYSLKNL